MNPHYLRLATVAGHRCEYCRAPENAFNSSFEVEHIIPVSKGGTNEDSNLALACRICNLYKADHLSGYDEATQTEKPLFHPRQNDWHDHFAFDEETGRVEGRTPTGRATVTRLHLNNPRQVAARQLWSILGLYP